MISNNKNNIANAMSGRTARACDSCVRRRARWYCTADDAFLCQVCDGSVHAANPLARRHERVRLKTASLSRADQDTVYLPSWNRGSTRKARTPRHGKHYSSSKSDNHNMELNSNSNSNPLHVVPELSVEEANSFTLSHGEEDEELLYRVPTYDPFVGELCNSSTTELEGSSHNHEFMIKSPPQDGFFTSDLDLQEFSADVQTLLGKGLEEEVYGIHDLGLQDCKCEVEMDSDDRVPFELSFDYEHDFATTCGVHKEEGHCHKVLMVDVKGNTDSEPRKFEGNDNDNEDDNIVMINKRRKILLRLDYEAVSSAWASQGSPWVNGQRPEITLEDCWPHCTGEGTSGLGVHQILFGDIQIGGNGDTGREARVSRYRQKRRRRLFSKKIRYEVRKLNAEKRPRMKGRFVKRSFAPPTSSFPLLSK